jgi:hypothetical protein
MGSNPGLECMESVAHFLSLLRSSSIAFSTPCLNIDHHPDRERGFPQSKNNLATDRFKLAPQLENRGLPLCNFAASRLKL